jgi:hypothetical protein
MEHPCASLACFRDFGLTGEANGHLCSGGSLSPNGNGHSLLEHRVITEDSRNLKIGVKKGCANKGENCCTWKAA